MSQYLLSDTNVEFFEPGDRVIFVIREINDASSMTELVRDLESRHPGVQFSFVGPVLKVLVERGE